MRKRLSRQFYTQPTLKIAKEILGNFLIHKIGNKKLVGKIIETEAYVGPDDLASHARGGKKTARNAAEFLEGGHIYIYLVYGMYWQFNISTYKEGYPECILIRALEPVEGIKEMRKNRYSRIYNELSRTIRDLTNGPGKLCQAMKFGKSCYGINVARSDKIWLEDRGERPKPSQIIASPRIGIDYAGPFWSKKLWRFYIKNNKFVSRSY